MNFDIENSVALPIHEYRLTKDDTVFHCADCKDVLHETEWDNEIDDLKFCGNCWQNLSKCAICEERFAHEPQTMHDLEFCSDGCIDAYRSVL